MRELARRLGASIPASQMSDAELLDDGLLRGAAAGLETDMAEVGWVDRALPFETAHFLDGFPQPDGRFRFKPDWAAIGPRTPACRRSSTGAMTTSDRATPIRLKLIVSAGPAFPELDLLRDADLDRARAAADAPAAPGRRHAAMASAKAQRVRIGNARGSVVLAGRRSTTASSAGTLIVEGIWPADAFEERHGINTLIGGDPVPPNGGAAFHDTAVWLRLV